MPIQHVMELLNIIDTDPQLRAQLYRCVHPNDVMKYLNANGYEFSMDEFEDAVRILHLRCQSYEDADALLHKADWLRLQILPNQI